MKIRQVGIILAKDIFQGPKSFLFIWAIIAPVVISIVVSLALGGFVSSSPRLGIFDQGNSQLLEIEKGLETVNVNEYSTIDALKTSVERGSLDMGVVLPAGLDETLAAGERITIESFVWGSSPEQDRALLRTSLMEAFRELIGDEPFLEVELVTVGAEDYVPWKDRLLPFLVLMAVFLGGAFLPAGAMIEEKERGTLRALMATPATLGEIMLAKGIIGVIVSLFMGVVILLLNSALSGQILLLLLVLGLGGVMASEIGLISGVLLEDITSLFAIWKAGGILLFAPGFVYLFPQIPQWVGKIIPTYYYIAPVVNITQDQAGWSGISSNVFILIGIDLALIGLLSMITIKTQRRMI
jgi:ABC-2 type transport system permease protein